MPVLVNKSRRAVVISSVGVAVPPGKSVKVRSVNPEIAKLVEKGVLAPVEALGVVPEPAPEPAVVPEPVPEPTPEPEAEPEVAEADAAPRRRGRPAKSEA